MKVLAKSRNLSISAQKLRLCTAGLRGQSVTSALQLLAAQPKKGSVMVFDTVKTAQANAINNFKLNKAQLSIDEIRVDQAAKLKRWRPRSRGMAHPIEHPKAHLLVVLTDQTDQVKNNDSKKVKK